MCNISVGDLVPGDVLLYKGDGIVSILIRVIDNSPVNHASIYIGGEKNEVGEATGKGLKRREIEKSISDDKEVLVRRLKTLPADMSPVLNIAESYLSTGNRYAFEQIFILAFLCLTRKLSVNKYLKWLIRKVLDSAADLITGNGQSQPMICSEFVYRCYDEALPGPFDIFRLNINPFPFKTVSSVSGERTANGLTGLHRESLLAWSIDEFSGSREKVLLKNYYSLAEGGTVSTGEDKGEGEYEQLSLNDLGKLYLDELKTQPGDLLSLEADLRDHQMLYDIKKFSDVYYNSFALSGERLRTFTPGRSGDIDIPDSLIFLKKDCADFVTPGDLFTCEELITIGRLR